MGSRKIGISEGIREGRDIGREAGDQARDLNREGGEIRRCLDSIDTSMDEDDVGALDRAETGYDHDFHNAFDEQVETRAEQAEQLESRAIDESGAELDKVTDAADRFREMAGLTDIGSEHANDAADRMNLSAAEYQEYIDQAENICEETQNMVDSLRSDLDSLFF